MQPALAHQQLLKELVERAARQGAAWPKNAVTFSVAWPEETLH